jgi:hypothetical protein
LQRDLVAQKDTNYDLQTKIGVIDAERIEAVKKLRLLQQKRQYTHSDAEHHRHDVQDKLAIIKQLEAQRKFAEDKTLRLQKQIDFIQLQLATDSRVL